MRVKLALCALALSGCTASVQESQGPTKAERELADALKGRTSGEPVDCISTMGLQGPQVIDSKTVLYRESGRTVWRAELPDGCPSLRPLDTLVVEVWGAQLCRNDRFRSITPGMSIPGAYCRFGRFTPYRKP